MSAPPLSWVFPFLVSPIYSISPCLSYSPRRQCFLGRSPGYSSQGIRGPPPGGDIGSNHGGGPRGLSPTQYLFWFLKGDCTCRDGLGTTQMDNLITDDALLPCSFSSLLPPHPPDPKHPRVDTCPCQPSAKPPHETMRPSCGAGGAFGFQTHKKKAFLKNLLGVGTQGQRWGGQGHGEKEKGWGRRSQGIILGVY